MTAGRALSSVDGWRFGKGLSVLTALRAKTGWARALACAVLFAFALGLTHAHAPNAAGSNDASAVMTHNSHDGHSHGDEPVDSVTAHCAFCAIVAGKFFLSSDAVSLHHPLESRVTFVVTGKVLEAAVRDGFFRPPIAALG